MRTLNISEEGFTKFMAIKATRPQDDSRGATFDHVLYVYEESKFRPPRDARTLILEKQKLEQEAKKV